jgi:hypothetical protein
MHKHLPVEISQWLSPGSVSLEGHHRSGLPTEVKHAEMIGDKVQASKAEGLEEREDGRGPQPSVWGHEKLQQAKENHITQACEAKGVRDEGHPIVRMVDT